MAMTYLEMVNQFNIDPSTIKKPSYPVSDEFVYHSRLKTINLDRRRVQDIINNRAFIIGPTEKIQKDIKSDKSIFSSKFGSTLKDLNPYIDRYKCKCGHLKGSVNNGMLCPYCNTMCVMVGDDFEYGAYIVLKKHYVIHPNIYKKLESFIGAPILEGIIKMNNQNDIDGHEIVNNKRAKDSPFHGIGMIDFYERFDEILQYYRNKKKEPLYEDIMENRDAVFTQSIYVFTALMRPIDPDATTLPYESTNGDYYMIASLVTKINDDDIEFRNNKKTKNDLLYDLQMKYMDLYAAIIQIISTKKGNFRTVFGGRCNFAGRNVIRQNTALDIDQVVMSYYSLVELLQQRIINILQRMYNITYSQAYDIWWKANLVVDTRVANIINSLITGSYMGMGLPVLVNRNPTITIGSILQMFVVGMSYDHTLSVPLRILKLFKGDFDGDVTNSLLIINKEFLELAFKTLNPKNSMMLSRNDGMYNTDTENQRDTIINADTMWNLSMNRYTPEELALIYNITDRLA